MPMLDMDATVSRSPMAGRGEHDAIRGRAERRQGALPHRWKQQCRVVIAGNDIDTIRSGGGELANRRQLAGVRLGGNNQALQRFVVGASDDAIARAWHIRRLQQLEQIAVDDEVKVAALAAQGVEKADELVAPPEILVRMPVSRRVATRTHVQVADDDDRTRGGTSLIDQQRGAEKNGDQPQHYGSFANEAFRISLSLRTKMCLFA